MPASYCDGHVLRDTMQKGKFDVLESWHGAWLLFPSLSFDDSRFSEVMLVVSDP